MKGPSRAGGIRSIETGARIIDALTEAVGPMSLKEISAATGLGSSTCHRYLTSYVRIGAARQDPASSRYDLGPRMMYSGLKALSRLDSMAAGLAASEKLVAATGHTVVLAIWSERGPVVVNWRMGAKIIRSNIAVGSVVPIMYSAVGSALLAYLPKALTFPLLAAEDATEEQAEALIADVRAKGYSLMGSQAVPSLSAVAAPILNCEGEAVIAAALTGLMDGFASEAIDSLLRICGQASSEMGWGHEYPPRP